jgi:hypothetical protein
MFDKIDRQEEHFIGSLGKDEIRNKNLIAINSIFQEQGRAAPITSQAEAHKIALRAVTGEHETNQTIHKNLIFNYSPRELNRAFGSARQTDLENLETDSYESRRKSIEILAAYYKLDLTNIPQDLLESLSIEDREMLSIKLEEVTPLNIDDYYVTSRPIKLISGAQARNGELSPFEYQLTVIKSVLSSINLYKTLNKFGLDYKEMFNQRINQGKTPEQAHEELGKIIFELFKFISKNAGDDFFKKYEAAYSKALPFRFSSYAAEPLLSNYVFELNEEDFDKVSETFPDIKNSKFSQYSSWYEAYLANTGSQN